VHGWAIPNDQPEGGCRRSGSPGCRQDRRAPQPCLQPPRLRGRLRARRPLGEHYPVLAGLASHCAPAVASCRRGSLFTPRFVGPLARVRSIEEGRDSSLLAPVLYFNSVLLHRWWATPFSSHSPPGRQWREVSALGQGDRSNDHPQRSRKYEVIGHEGPSR
jgi:hypothetical protein